MSNIEEHIRRAMEAGQFDHLPGKGKPLRLEENPFEDPEWRLAYRALRNGGFSLPWIETRRDIEAKLEKARAVLQSTREWRDSPAAHVLTTAQVEVEWARAVENFRLQIEALNQRIRDYNIGVPSDRFQMRQLIFERELELTTSLPSDTLPEAGTAA